MSSPFQKIACRLAVTTLAVVCLSAAQAQRPAFALPPAVHATCITHDLVYVLTKGGSFQNVTSTLYTNQGNTYCVCDGETRLIFPDYNAETVRDCYGNVIGYTMKTSDTPQ